ncbi:MAG TPA: ABC transporter ATP-binding protein [Thermoanaerobaculia bacterium]|nr:ABC transporter ATP-binding protein [Thermoanaerobaculia bacterium]
MASRRTRQAASHKETPSDAADKKTRKKLDRARLKVLLGEAGAIIHRSRRRLLLGLPLMLVNRLAGIVLPGTTKLLIDDVIGKGNVQLLWKIALVAGLAAIIDASSGFALSQLLGVAAQRSITSLRLRIQQHLQRLPVRYFDSTKTGALVSRVMNDAEGIRNLVGTGLVNLFGGLITAIVAIGILFYLSTKLTLMVIGVLVVFGAVLFWAFKKLRPLFKARGELNSTVMGRLSEGLSGIRVIKAYRAERREARLFAQGAHDLLRNVMGTMRTVSAVGSISTLLVGTIGIAILIVGGREVLAGRLTVGGLISFTLYLGLVVAPVVQIVSIGSQLSEAFAGLERMREVFDEPTEDADDASKPSVSSFDGHVSFNDVSFEYTKDLPVLHGITFDAPAGSSTALVGSSGSGKSTLISLIAAFHRPGSGSIQVDGRDLQTLRLSEYRQNLGIVLQDPFLFGGTLIDNIALGNRGASRDELERAAAIAHVADFARALPDGYETIVGERGVKLSGGQKQRVAIARAIVADPRILILDEATSSLDSESESLIQEGLAILMKGRTTFVIAHRLSTVRNVDTILVLEGGRIVEKGNHNTLLASGGRYATLYEKQYGAAANRYVNPGEELRDFEKEPALPSPSSATPR